MSSLNKIYAVFDCNIFLQAIAKKQSPAGSCYKLAEQRVIKLFVSKDILTEIEDVLSRDYIRKQFKSLTNESVKDFLTSIKNIAEIVKEVPKGFSLPRDIDDEPYINLAVECEADYIVTRDNDLLYLMTDYNIKSKEFRQKTRPLRIIKPLEFLKIIEETRKENLGIKP